MAVSKKSVGSGKTPKQSPKPANTKVAATKITPAKMHTTAIA